MTTYDYDYDLQVWIIDGIIQDCGHPASMGCITFCNQRAYAGQPIAAVKGGTDHD